MPFSRTQARNQHASDPHSAGRGSQIKQAIIDSLDRLNEKDLNFVVDKVINIDKFKASSLVLVGGVPQTADDKKDETALLNTGEKNYEEGN